MNAVIFKTVNAEFEFDQKEVKELIARKKSKYDLDEVAKLLEQISDKSNEAIMIPDEPVYFDYIAMDLIAAGKGSVLCKTCNKTYVARQLKSIKVGCGSPLDIKREKKGVIKRLFAKKRKPPTMHGGEGFECPAGHNLLTVITWKTF